ncbi:TetR/AcrR family transcriptional regulator [Croceicoccus mobilis]|uniref:HTH tetR-type domain-containing protein n=1 Tax=Croceicoccus mobilis TaxID=1703339 RepID=A0A916Z839_9SPHN|nr:TetR/AcrR family transcriptional regulator [Croceicoccus mobilis]GGD80574.1 hypothetical protein GCM10010990_33070 [Croceicoccus mobilis]
MLETSANLVGTLNANAACVLDHAGSISVLRPAATGGRLAQRQRRESILATAREMIGRNGYERLVLREVADMCGVSVQTVYNLVGDRSNVLASAVTEFIEVAFQHSSHFSDFPNRFLAVAHVYWATAANSPEYVREATLAYYSTQSQYREQVSGAAIRIFVDALIAMKRQGQLRADLDLRSVAHRFAQLAAADVFDWASGARSIERLRLDLLDSHAMILEHALVPAEAARVRDWIARQHDIDLRAARASQDAAQAA